MAGDAPWWNADYEKNFYEAAVVVVLVLLAMVFEDVFHSVTHTAEQSYAYGASEDRHQNEEDRAHEHKQLYKELAQRVGTEFMTLGFLACCVFLCNILGFFELLADMGASYGSSDGESDATGASASVIGSGEHHRLLAGVVGSAGLLVGPGGMPMPRTAGDFLHLTEEVHIRIFFGMVIYFSIVASVIQAVVTRLKVLAELTNRKLLTEAHKLSDPHDSALAEYKQLLEYTIEQIMRWQMSDKERWEQVVRAVCRDELEFEPGGSWARDEVRHRLGEQFSLAHYLSSTLAHGVLDIIEVHRVTWGTLMVLFVFFMFLHWQKVRLIFIAGAILFVGIIMLGAACRRARQHNHNMKVCAHAATLVDFPSIVPDDSAIRLGIPKAPQVNFFSQFLILRTLETILFIWCYSFSSIMFNREGWENELLISLVQALLYTIFTFAASSFLPEIVTNLLIQLSLPQHLEKGHLEILLRVLRDDDPALFDLALNGSDDIQRAVTRMNVHDSSASPGRGRAFSRGLLRQRAVSDESRATSAGSKRRAESSEDTTPWDSSDLHLLFPPPQQAVQKAPSVVPDDSLSSLADTLSAVLATPNGLEMVRFMVEEVALLRTVQIDGLAGLPDLSTLANVQQLEPQQLELTIHAREESDDSVFFV